MEVCIDNIVSAQNAIEGGAIRLELCSDLSEGGLTPTVGFLKVVKQLSKIPVFAMLRPRIGDDFVYTENDVKIIEFDLKILKDNGADGFVFGALTPEREIDTDLCKEIVKLAAPLPVTFHRAFDYVINPLDALENLIQLGFKRILTSGQAPTAEKGLMLIKELITAARDRIIILPGGGINDLNLEKILTETGVKEFHGSAKKRFDSVMLQDRQLNHESSIDLSRFVGTMTDKEEVARLTKIAEKLSNNFKII